MAAARTRVRLQPLALYQLHQVVAVEGVVEAVVPMTKKTKVNLSHTESSNRWRRSSEWGGGFGGGGFGGFGGI